MTELRGRDDERSVIHALLDTTRSGRGGVVVVEGEAGAGKSVLVGDAVQVAAGCGFDTAVGASAPAQPVVALGVLWAALREPNLVSCACVTEPPALRRDDVATALVARATRAPVLVALDDIQWADPATLFALRALAVELASEPIAWLVSRRPRVGGHLVDWVCDGLVEAGARTVELPPLRARAVAEVVTDVLGVPGDRDLIRRADETGGDPALLVALVEGWRDEGMVEIRDGVARVVGVGTPRRVGAVVDRRLAMVSSHALRLLEIAAVLGPTFALDDVAEVQGEPVARLLAPVEEVLHAGELVAVGDALGFRQELCRRVISEQMAEPVRRALHRQVGRMLLARGTSAVDAAQHLLDCAQEGDDLAADGLARAARELELTSPESAAVLALRSLDLTRPSDGEQFARAVTAVHALTAAGRFADAAYIAQAALDAEAPVVESADLRCALSGALLRSAELNESIRVAEHVLATRNVPRRLTSTAEALRLQAVLAQDDITRASGLATALVANRRRSGDTARAAALVALAFAAWREGRLTDAFTAMRDAARRADVARTTAVCRPSTLEVVSPRLSLALLLTATGEFAEADAAIRDAAAALRPAGTSSGLGGPSLYRSRLDLAMGRLDDAVSRAEASLAIAEERGTVMYAGLAVHVLAVAAIRRGDLAAASGYLDRGDDHPPVDPAMPRSFRGLWMRAQLTEAESGPVRAMQLLEGSVEHLCHYPGLVMEPPSAAWLVRIALAVGDAAHAAIVHDMTERIAAANPQFPSVTAMAIHARGLVERDVGCLLSAADTYPHPWLQASAAEDAGALQAECGDRDGAARSLDRANRGYERAGALRDARRVQRRLHRVHIRRRARHADRPRFGWESLTPNEQTAAELVATGLTNRVVAARMFLSPHTVDFHLRQTFRKLGITTRVELGALVREHEVTASNESQAHHVHA